MQGIQRFLLAGGAIAVLLASAPAAAHAACSNEAIRIEQGSTHLPECRGYELVSPAQKNNTNVSNGPGMVVASADGSRVSFASNGGFEPAEGSGGVANSIYLAERSADRWGVAGLTPPQATSYGGIFFGSTVGAFSADLSKWAITSYDPQLTDDAQPGVMNLYRGGADGGFDLLSASSTPLAPDSALSYPAFAAASADFSSILFESNQALTPDAVPFSSNVYLWRDGELELELASVLPDGSAASMPQAGGEPGSLGSAYVDWALSADGERAIFQAPPAPGEWEETYLRKPNGEVVTVSESEASSPEPPLSQSRAWDASSDGRQIVFVSTTRLLDGADSDGGSNLYRYSDSPSPESENNLELLSPDTDPLYGTVEGAVGMSDDGSRVYFITAGRLTEDHAATSPINTYLYVWDNGELRYVDGLNSSDQVTQPDRSSNWFQNIPKFGSTGKAARVSSNGRYILYQTASAEGFSMLKLFDAQSGEPPSCVSCPSSGAPRSDASIIVPKSAEGATLTRPYLSRSLAEDGTVYFHTADSLVPRDQNGHYDVYRWHDGSVSLLTSGVGSANSYFADAGADGNDVFVLTGARLVATDRDWSNDLYDVRVEGGRPNPPAPEACAGEACQGPPGAPLAVVPPGTGALEGPGNVRSRRACGTLQKRLSTVQSRLRNASGKNKQKLKGKRAKIRRELRTCATGRKSAGHVRGDNR